MNKLQASKLVRAYILEDETHIQTVGGEVMQLALWELYSIHREWLLLRKIDKEWNNMQSYAHGVGGKRELGIW